DRRAPHPGGGAARAGGAARLRPPPPHRAVGRPAPARGHRPGAGDPAPAGAGGRAHRQPRLGHRREHHRPDEGAEPRRPHHLHLLHPRRQGDGPRQRGRAAGRRQAGGSGHAGGGPAGRGLGPAGGGGDLMGWLSTFGLTAQIAFRNLFASRLKTIIVGGIIFFGAFLVVLLGSLVDSIDHAMSRSVVGSVAGHIQVYSADSKDDLAVMGGFSMEGDDLAPIDDFAKLQKTLLEIDNVKAVVPMGISGAIVASGNTIDVALEKLRESVRQKSGSSAAAAEYERKYQAQKGHVRQMIKVLRTDYENMGKVRQETAQSREEAAAVARAASEEFWGDFDRDPLDHLEFLENKVAPAATDADMLFLRYVGTDPVQFAHTFDRMKIVDGQAIPPGKRGFLFSKFVYEEQLKLKTAH